MSQKLLDSIYNPEDLRKLNSNQLPELAKELRDFIIDIVATKEGHLGASLGVIELTIALHYLFDTPNDLLVWDVGHQAYVHKILTERKDLFHTNRRLMVFLVSQNDQRVSMMLLVLDIRQHLFLQL